MQRVELGNVGHISRVMRRRPAVVASVFISHVSVTLMSGQSSVMLDVSVLSESAEIAGLD